jgi:ATP-dependent DNA helicase RecG
MLNLKQSVTVIKGIGEETAEGLAEMNIFTVQDLLEHFPYRYEDYRLRDLAEVKHEERVTVEGKVHSEPSLAFFGRKKSRLTLRLLVDRYLIQVTFFNQPYLKKKISISDTVTVTGKWDSHRQMITASELTVGSTSKGKELEPVYAVKGNITVKGIRKFIQLAFTQWNNDLEETLPATLLARYKLLTRREALRALHFPLSHDETKQARRRFVYEEFLHFQLKIQALRKYEREHSKGIGQNYCQ